MTYGLPIRAVLRVNLLFRNAEAFHTHFMRHKCFLCKSPGSVTKDRTVIKCLELKSLCLFTICDKILKI